MASITPSASSELVDLFATIYYFFPCLRDRKKREISIYEPRDAILWFLDLMRARDQKSALPKKELMNFVFRWYGAPRTIQRHYEQLADAKLIERIDNDEDEREKVVWLTQDGFEKLSKLKNRRSTELEVLWHGLGKLNARESKRIFTLLRLASEAAMRHMSLDIDNDAFGKAWKPPKINQQEK